MAITHKIVYAETRAKKNQFTGKWANTHFIEGFAGPYPTRRAARPAAIRHGGQGYVDAIAVLDASDESEAARLLLDGMDEAEREALLAEYMPDGASTPDGQSTPNGTPSSNGETSSDDESDPESDDTSDDPEDENADDDSGGSETEDGAASETEDDDAEEAVKGDASETPALEDLPEPPEGYELPEGYHDARNRLMDEYDVDLTALAGTKMPGKEVLARIYHFYVEAE